MKNKAIIYIIVGGIFLLWSLTNFPFLLKNLSLISDPNIAGHVTGSIGSFLVSIFCVIYGFILLKRSNNSSNKEN